MGEREGEASACVTLRDAKEQLGGAHDGTSHIVHSQQHRSLGARDACRHSRCDPGRARRVAAKEKGKRRMDGRARADEVERQMRRIAEEEEEAGVVSRLVLVRLKQAAVGRALARRAEPWEAAAGAAVAHHDGGVRARAAAFLAAAVVPRETAARLLEAAAGAAWRPSELAWRQGDGPEEVPGRVARDHAAALLDAAAIRPGAPGAEAAAAALAMSGATGGAQAAAEMRVVEAMLGGGADDDARAAWEEAGAAVLRAGDAARAVLERASRSASWDALCGGMAEAGPARALARAGGGAGRQLVLPRLLARAAGGTATAREAAAAWSHYLAPGGSAGAELVVLLEHGRQGALEAVRRRLLFLTAGRARLVRALGPLAARPAVAAALAEAYQRPHAVLQLNELRDAGPAAAAVADAVLARALLAAGAPPGGHLESTALRAGAAGVFDAAGTARALLDQVHEAARDCSEAGGAVAPHVAAEMAALHRRACRRCRAAARPPHPHPLPPGRPHTAVRSPRAAAAALRRPVSPQC